MTDSTDRGEIHLGDLARALASLDWQDNDQAQAIARCLGFGLREPPPARSTEIYDRLRYRPPSIPPSEPPARPRIFVPPAPEMPTALPDHTLDSQLQALKERAPSAPGAPDWLKDDDANFESDEGSAVIRQSLFHERTHRHILAAALATRRVGLEIDAKSLIDRLCRREVVARLPYLCEPSLDKGCQLLLDYSATMVPFWEDLAGLVGQVQQVVSAQGTRAYSFDGQPTEAFQWTAEGEQVPWAPDGSPVLAATDFGIQGRLGKGSPSSAWTELIERCERSDSPLVILIPWPEQRWPLELGRYPKLVHWSPHTSAAMIRKMIGIGHHPHR